MNWKRAAIGAAAIAPLIALLGFGMTRDPKSIPSPLPGRAAPDFSLAVMPMGVPDGAPEPASTDTVRLAEGHLAVHAVPHHNDPEILAGWLRVVVDPYEGEKRFARADATQESLMRYMTMERETSR